MQRPYALAARKLCVLLARLRHQVATRLHGNDGVDFTIEATDVIQICRHDFGAGQFARRDRSGQAARIHHHNVGNRHHFFLRTYSSLRRAASVITACEALAGHTTLASTPVAGSMAVTLTEFPRATNST